MFFGITGILLQKKRVNSTKFAEEIRSYFKACITYLLPCRLHDVSFLNMVNEDLLDNKKPLIVNFKTLWTQNKNSPLDYLN
jgi:hypothetical protein